MSQNSKLQTQLKRTYEAREPLIQDSTHHLNGLMLVVRPAVEDLMEVTDSFPRTARHGFTRRTVKGAFDIPKPGVDLYSVEMHDRHQRKGRDRVYDYTEDGLVDSKFTLWTARVDTNGRTQCEESLLTWGYADSALVYGDPETSEGVIGTDRAHLSYENTDALDHELATAYTKRLASGMLIGHMLDQAAEIKGTQPTDHDYERAAQLAGEWALVSDAATEVWGRYEQLIA
jgi:hypothetical protein